MLEPQIIKRLCAIAGLEHVSTDKADLICYSYDATQKSFLPEVVVHPGNAVEISQILKLANETKVPVIPRGAGSGFTGGSLPTSGGILLVTTRHQLGPINILINNAGGPPGGGFEQLDDDA